MGNQLGCYVPFSDRRGSNVSSSSHSRAAPMLTQWDTVSAASLGLPSTERQQWQRTPPLRSALLRRQPLKRVSVFLWRATLDICCQPWLGPELAQRCPSTLKPEAAGERGGPSWVRPEERRVWSRGGARIRRMQNVNFSRRQTWEVAQRAGSWSLIPSL